VSGAVSALPAPQFVKVPKYGHGSRRHRNNGHCRRLAHRHRAQPILGRFGDDRPTLHIRHDSAQHCLCYYPTSENAPVLKFQVHKRRNCTAYIGVTGWCRIDETRFKVGSGECHKVPGFGAAKRSMRALTLLEYCVGNHGGTTHRFPAYGVEGAKVHDNGWLRYYGRTIKIYIHKGQRAWKSADLLVNENTADVILAKQLSDQSADQCLIPIQTIDKIGTRCLQRPPIWGDPYRHRSDHCHCVKGRRLGPPHNCCQDRPTTSRVP
jgi:hypothetical protein